MSGNTVYNHFSTGTEYTLLEAPRKAGIDIVKVLEDFHAAHYVPSRMKLAVCSPRPLAEVRSFIESTFGSIPSQEPVPYECPSDPTPQSKDRKRFIYVVPVSERHALRFMWALPEKSADYEYGCADYMTYVIGHEGPGSLALVIKSRGWGNSLVSGRFEMLSNFCFLGVEIELTEEGLRHIDEMVSLVFEFVALMKRQGPQHETFKEIELMARIGFLFEEREGPAEDAQRWIDNMASGRRRKHYLNGQRVMEKYDPERIAAMIDYLSLDRVNIYILSPTVSVKCNLTEKWYGTSYGVEHIEGELEKTCRDVASGIIPPSEELFLPAPNRFIASNFDLLPLPPHPPTRPDLLCSDRYCQVWYMQDAEFRQPHTSVTLNIRSVVAYCSPELSVLTTLLGRLIGDVLNPLSDEARSANLNLVIRPSDTGLVVSVWGLSHKVPDLLGYFLETLENGCAGLTFDRFAPLREQLLRELQNYNIVTNTYMRSVYYGAVATEIPRWDSNECAEALALVDLDRFQTFVREFFRSIYFMGLVEGNISREGAWGIVDRVRRSLFGGCNGKAVQVITMSPHGVTQMRRSVKFPLGMSIYENHDALPTDCNCSVLWRFQVCEDSPRSYALTMLFETVVERTLKSELRGEKELGYVVMSFVRREYGAVYWNVLVQTDRRIELAESYVSEFINVSAPRDLAAQTRDSFATLCAGVAASLRQPYASLVEQAEVHFRVIELLSFDFDRRKEAARLVEEGGITIDDVREFYERHIGPKAPKRRVLLTRVCAGKQSTPQSALALAEREKLAPAFPDDDVAVHKIDSIGEWKRTRPLNPGVESKL